MYIIFSVVALNLDRSLLVSKSRYGSAASVIVGDGCLVL